MLSPQISRLVCWRIIPPAAHVIFITLQRNSNSTQNSYSLSSQRDEHTTPDSKSLQHSPRTMNNNYNITTSHHHHNVETTTTSNIISSHPVYLQSDLWPLVYNSALWWADNVRWWEFADLIGKMDFCYFNRGVNSLLECKWAVRIFMCRAIFRLCFALKNNWDTYIMVSLGKFRYNSQIAMCMEARSSWGNRHDFSPTF